MKKNQSNHNKFIDSYKDIGPYLGLGTQLAVTIVVMFFIGHWLDKKFDLEPLFTIIFSFVGGSAGIYNFIKTTLDLNKKKKIDTDN